MARQCRWVSRYRLGASIHHTPLLIIGAYRSPSEWPLVPSPHCVPRRGRGNSSRRRSAFDPVQRMSLWKTRLSRLKRSG
ncbi:hypothetical protein VC34_11305 [Pseudomonas fluorescens]|uniref:Uncharacterized protein n=1 Tax=Pseudomonas fluorescens TaxID=294 RepID=A0A0F4TKM2_PSEFL|nr:hypothetical protein VC34_11305 [Pseudomonas fluorescens]